MRRSFTLDRLGAARQPDRPMAARVWWRDVGPIAIASVFAALYFRIDVLLLGLWRPIEDVARYNAVYRLVEAMRLFPAAVLTVALPAVLTRRDAGFAWRLSGGLAIFGVLAAVAVWIIAPQLIALTYGARYADAVPVLRVLLLAFPLFALNYGLTHHVLGWNGHRELRHASMCRRACDQRCVQRVVDSGEVAASARHGRRS